MGSLSIWHWLIVLLIVALVFGTKKLRGMGADLGHAVKEFKDSAHGESKETQIIEMEKPQTPVNKTDSVRDNAR